MRKCANIFSYMRRLLVISDFATAPLGMKIIFSFLSVYLHLDDVVCDGGATVGLWGRPGQVAVAGTPVKDIRPTRLRWLV
jgi:hypothetical protein